MAFSKGVKRKKHSTEESKKVKVSSKKDNINFGKQFRMKLSTDDAINALNDFLEANKKDDVVMEYLDAGGNANELLTILNRSGNKNYAAANTVFASLNLIIMKCANELLMIQESLEKSCEELLNIYQSTLQVMLCSLSSCTSHRITVLKLLTGIVTLNCRFGKRILADISINPRIIRILTNSQNWKLRLSFIHYLLSFFVDGNSVVICELLKLKGLLTSIFYGMKNDSPETIVLVLNTLRSKLVEDIRIPKTSKLHVFNTAVLHMLFELYAYTYANNDDEKEKDFDPVQIVRETVHSLLLLLCTSHKIGVLFRDHGTVSSGKSSNQLILTLVERIEEPWKDDLKSELVMNITKVCPEILKIIYLHVEKFYTPSVSDEWINVIIFLQKLINVHQFDGERITESNAYSYITTHSFPHSINKFVKNLTNENIHNHPIIRYYAATLLLTVLRKVEYYIICCRSKFDHLFVANLKDQLEQFLSKNMLHCSKLFSAWKLGLKIDGVEIPPANSTKLTTEFPTIEEYHETFADLALLYCKLSPTVGSYVRLNDYIDLDSIDINSSRLRCKVAELIFYAYNPKPNDAKFPFVLSTLLDHCSEGFTSDNIVQNVFLASGFFDGFEDEIVIWLRCLQQTHVGDLFANAFSLLATEYEHVLRELADIRPSHEQHAISLQDLNDEPDLSEWVSVSDIKISPVFVAFLKVFANETEELDSYQKKIRKQFLDLLLFHMLHMQLNADVLLSILNKYNSIYLSKKILKYINFWNKNDVSKMNICFDGEGVCILYSKLAFANANLDKVLQKLEESDEFECTLVWNMCIFYAVHLDKKQILTEQFVSNNIKIFEAISKRMLPDNLVACLKVLLSNEYVLDKFADDLKKGNSCFTYFVVEVVEVAKNSINRDILSKMVSLFRLRFISALTKLVSLKKHFKLVDTQFSIEQLIQFVMLPNKRTLSLLKCLSTLPEILLYHEKRKILSMWSEIIRHLFIEAANDPQESLDNDILNVMLEKISTLSSIGIDTENLENSVIYYLTSFPHHIRTISDDNLNVLFTKPELGKLELFLLPHHKTQLPKFKCKILQLPIVEDGVVFLKALSCIQSFTDLDEDLMALINDRYVSMIIDIVKSGEEIFDNQTELLAYLLKYCDGTDQFAEVCVEMEEKGFQSFSENNGHLFYIIFQKAQMQTLFIKLLLMKFNEMISETNNINWLCTLIREVISNIDDIKFITSHESWKQFVKNSLKTGLQVRENSILQTMRNVCEKALLDDERESATIFQMTVSHSQFIDLMLSNLDVKCELLGMLLCLVTLNKSLMSSNHIPLLLGAYNASLSKSDQIIFQLLQWYEENGVRLSDCRPYLWGEAAVAQYSVRSVISLSLKKVPFANHVLNLLDVDMIKKTIQQYPLERGLQPGRVIFKPNSNVYDISFILPLLSHALAPESKISMQKFTRSCGLSLILISLSSEANDVRLAGYHCLQRFQSHLVGRDKEVHLWDHFVNALKNGVLTKNGTTENDVAPRLPCVVTNFMAEMSRVISEPMHSLFVPLTNFLLAKPSFDVGVVPNFLILYFSTDLKYRDHQEWILKVVRDGIRCKLDCFVIQKCFLFKLLMQYGFSSLSNDNINILILEIIKAALAIVECRLNLITKCGLLPWLNMTVNSMKETKLKAISHLIEILHVLSSTKNSNLITKILLNLLPKFTHETESTILEKFFHALSQSYSQCRNNDLLIDEADMQRLLSLAGPMLTCKRQMVLNNCVKLKSIPEPGDGKIDSYVCEIILGCVENL